MWIESWKYSRYHLDIFFYIWYQWYDLNWKAFSKNAFVKLKRPVNIYVYDKEQVLVILRTEKMLL